MKQIQQSMDLEMLRYEIIWRYNYSGSSIKIYEESSVYLFPISDKLLLFLLLGSPFYLHPPYIIVTMYSPKVDLFVYL